MSRVVSVFQVALTATLLFATAAPLLRADDPAVGQVAAVVDLKKIDLTLPDKLTPAYGRLSADGARLAAITANESAFWLVDTVNGKQLHFMRSEDFTPKVNFNLPGFSPDGKLATAEEGGVVHILDAETGKELLNFKAPGRGLSNRFSPDGKWLAVYGGGLGNLYNATTGEMVFVIFDPKDYGKTNQLESVSFSPDGKRLLVCEKFRIKVMEIDTGKEVLAIATGDRTPSEGLFSPDG